MPSAPFSKIAILGPGLIGGSILLGAVERRLSRTIAVWDHQESSLAEVRESGLPCSCCASVLEAVAEAELVILCVPIGAMRPILTSALDGLDPSTIVTDVGSVKSGVVDEMSLLLRGHAAWIGGHPMAGRELTGFAAARADLFEGAVTVLTPTPETTARAREAATLLWQGLGATVLEMEPLLHDRLVGEISHLPHLVAAALAQSVSAASLKLAGQGFRDTTRIASGPAEMWQEILLANRDTVGESLDRLIDTLQTARRTLATGDAVGLHRILSAANQVRQHIVKS